MTRREIARQARQMREDWDRRAAENARYYVATGKEEWSEEEFYRSGEVNLKQFVLNDLGNVCQGRDPKDMKVLEIGCGAGRITRAMAGVFGRVYGVDISREMVRQARRAVAGFPNARIFRNNGRDLSVVRDHWWQRFGWGQPLQVDFVFSYIVFQHIPSREIIESYVREAGRLLRPGGLFKFQVQGSPLAGERPDTWEGVAFNEQEARRMAERCGFEMRHHHAAGDQYYWLWFFKKGGEDREAREEYRRTGELELQHHIVGDGNICQGKGPKEMRVLEIGREGPITAALARYFGEVSVVDPGGEAPRLGAPRGRKRPFDFAFSPDAFGRLESRERMESYLREIHAVLRPGALFKFGVPGGTVGETALGEDEAREMAERCGFALRHREAMGAADCWLWLFKRTDEELRRIGELTVEHYIRNDLTNVCQGKQPKDMRVVFEAGWGEEGITRALAGFFGEVRKAEGSRRRPADFAFAFSAFQQMASREQIESVVRDVHRHLRPGALFKFRVRGSGTGGAAFSEREAREMAARCGFEMRSHHGSGQQDYWVWFFNGDGRKA